MQQGYHKADLILLVVTLIAAAGWIFSREALVGFKPLTFMGARFLLAGIILSLFAMKALRQISRSQLRNALLVGLMFSFAMVLWIEGLYHSKHLGIGAFIFSLGVLLTPVMAWFFKDKPPFRVWAALPLGGLGLYLLSAGEDFHFATGEYLFIASAVSIALYINVTTRVVAKVPPLLLTTIQLTTVGVVLLLLAYFYEGIEWPTDINLWGWFAASVLLATSLRFLLQMRAHSLAPASHTAVFLTLEPVWVALLGAWWLQEQMSILQMSGCILIFVSILLTRLPALIAMLRGG
jgi:drug/metabolite transporter (DMT)-like permease